MADLVDAGRGVEEKGGVSCWSWICGLLFRCCLLAGEEAGRWRLVSVEAVAAEKMMGRALWWRSAAAIVGFSRCGWRLEGKRGYCA
jgi:hypothetical protein